MANKHILLNSCISKLDSMSQGLTDNRPKSLEKLKNTLKKETQVIYVNQLVIYLLTLDSTVPLKNEVEVYKTVSELDTEIVETVFKLAADQGRQVFVLPCDSHLHHQIGTAVTEWHNKEDRKLDPDNPVLDIASACAINARLDVDMIVKHLGQLDIVHQWLDLVSYKLPDEAAFIELRNVWEKWTEKIKSSLSETSAGTYGLFSALLRDANDAIQNSRIEEIENYCEEMYASKYPRYAPQKPEVDPFEEMETTDKNGSSEEVMLSANSEDDMSVPSEEKRAQLLNSPIYLWPVSLEPEVAYVILKLVQTEKKPETMHDFRHFVKSIGDITYVTSPKYILSNIAQDINTVSEDEDVVINVRLGSALTKKSFHLKDTSALGALLTYPRKYKPFQGKSFKQMRRNFKRMGTSRDHSKDTIEGFQENILKTAKLLGQRTGAALLFDDAEANTRCRDNLQEYLKSLSTGSVGISTEEFSRELMRLSYEFTAIPVEELVELLTGSGYLTVNEADFSVTYTQGFRKPRPVDTSATESSFLREWERFYKQTNDASDTEISAILSGRKRKIQTQTFTFGKKQKIIDI